jgi:hypothetical protein
LPSALPVLGASCLPTKSWQSWFDSKTCEVCGKCHPTKYHDDPGIRNHPYIPSGTHPVKKGNVGVHNPPRFKKGGRGKFMKSIHQALLDNVDDRNVDDELLTHMMDNTLQDDDVLLSGPGDEPPMKDDMGDDKADAAHALAAMGFGQLLNWLALHVVV